MKTFARKQRFTFLQSAFAFLFSQMILFAADWPQFLGPNRNGVSSETQMVTNWPKEGPPILWKKDIGEGFSGPVVAHGKLVLFHRVADKETVECFETKTGKPIWKFDYPTTYEDDFGFDKGPRATPAISGNHVYTYGAEGALHCLDFVSGKKIWSIDCKTAFQSAKGFFGHACSPLVEGNLVLLNVGGANGAGVVAFDKAIGKTVWKTSEDEASYSSPMSATFQGKRAAVFFTRRGLLALNPENGKPLFDFFWRPRIDASVNAASPLVIDDLIFLSTSYDTGAVLLRVKDNAVEKVWSSDDALSNHYATSVHHDGLLYGFHGRQEQGPDLNCIELKTGKVRWSKAGLGAGTVTLVGRQLLILSERGELLQATASPIELKIANRAQILPFGARAYPAFANGHLFARSKDKLVAVNLSVQGKPSK